MPGLDRTGPSGQGAMTGRKEGKCAKKNADVTKSELDETTTIGRGRGGGRRFNAKHGESGKGRGRGRQQGL